MITLLKIGLSRITVAWWITLDRLEFIHKVVRRHVITILIIHEGDPPRLVREVEQLTITQINIATRQILGLWTSRKPAPSPKTHRLGCLTFGVAIGTHLTHWSITGLRKMKLLHLMNIALFMCIAKILPFEAFSPNLVS